MSDEQLESLGIHLPSGAQAALNIWGRVVHCPQTVRLGKHVRNFPALPLAAAQMAAMAVLSDAWLAADVASAVTSGAAATSVWEGGRYSRAILLYML